MGEIMELTHNLSIYQCVHQAHMRIHTHTKACTFVRRCTCTHAYTCIFTDRCAWPQEIWMEWIMKLLLTQFTYDPLSITQMDTTLSYWSQPLLFHFSVALAVFHLVTSPLICISPLMVSVAVDGTINQRQRLAIITTETNWAHTPRPWKPQMSSLGMIHNSSDVHNGRPMGGCSSMSTFFVNRW